MIFNPLQKIEVVESNKKCRAGSTGYFICQDSVDGYNGWHTGVMFTRFGAKGKPRVEMVVFEMKMFEYDTFRKSDQNILNIVKEAEWIEPTNLSQAGHGRGRGDLIRTGGVRLKAVKPETKDLLSVSNMEFLAYISALSLYVYRLKYGVAASNLVNAISPLSFNRFADAGYHFDEAEPELIGCYILEGLRQEIKDESDSYMGSLLAYVNNPEVRMLLLEQLLKPFCMMNDTIRQRKEITESRYHTMKVRIDEIILYYRASRKRLKDVEKLIAEHRPWHRLISHRLAEQERRQIEESQKRDKGKNIRRQYKDKGARFVAVEEVEEVEEVTTEEVTTITVDGSGRRYTGYYGGYGTTGTNNSS